MARISPARFTHDADHSSSTGGPISAMHQALEARILSGQTPVPDWSDYSEALSPTEAAVHQLSRVMGIAALGAGIIAVAVAIVHIA